MPRNIILTLVAVVAAVAFHCTCIPLGEWGHAAHTHDAVFQTYLLAWGSHSLLTAPLGFYYPPIFFPDSHIVQSTDALELPALLMSPVWLIIRNPYLLANILVCLSHIFAIGAAGVVARRHFRLSIPLAFIVGCLFAFTSDRLWHAAAGHYNLVWSGIIPLVWYAATQTLHQPSRRHCIVLAALLGLSIYFSVYFFVLCALVVVMTLISASIIAPACRSRKPILAVVLALGAAVMVALPKILIYAWASRGADIERNSLAEAALYSADWRGYLLPSTPGGLLDPAQTQAPENNQFLGWFLCLLLVCEAVRLTIRFRRKPITPIDLLSLSGFAIAGIVIVCSFGPQFSVLGISPYKCLHALYLQFTGFYRVPARLAFVVQWFLLLPICALFATTPWFHRRIVSLGLAALTLPILLIEHTPLRQAPPVSRPVHRQLLNFLHAHDPAAAQPYADLTPGMTLETALSAIPDWRPTLNGWPSAALGARFDHRMRLLTHDFPSTVTVGWLAQQGAPWVIVHGATARQLLSSDERFEYYQSENESHLYRLHDLPGLRQQSESALLAHTRHVQDQRRQSPDTLALPPDSLAPGSSALPLSNHSTFDDAPPSHWYAWQSPSPFLPALYDTLTITYTLPDSNGGKHRAHIYWGEDGATLSPAREVKGRVRAASKPTRSHQSQYTARFTLSDSFLWSTDPSATWIALKLDRFHTAPPAVLAITNIEWSREENAQFEIPPFDNP